MTAHPILPVYDEACKVLILGSFPSVKSRETGFYYGHPQNRFWRVLAAVCAADVPGTIDEKRAFLLKRHIALWDVVAACDVTGSSDLSIKNAAPNDLQSILCAAPVRAVFTNGKTASGLYDRFFGTAIALPKYCLPSTSPANAAYSLARLTENWRVLADYINLTS